MEQQMLRPFSLPEMWSTYLNHIRDGSVLYWTTCQKHRSYNRVQSMAIWEKLRIWLRKITDQLLVPSLTPFETFLLHAAAYLYEIGWQTEQSPALTLPQRFVESGNLLLGSRRDLRREYHFGLFDTADQTYADDITLTLARICSAAGLTDLSTLQIDWQVACYEEQIRLRYLVALLQLANILLIDRANSNNLYGAALLDLWDARLALHHNIRFEEFQPGKLAIAYALHPADRSLEEKMLALYEEPLRQWWSTNQAWLAALGCTFALVRPRQTSLLPPRLSETCQMLPTFLETFQPAFPCTYDEPLSQEKKKRFRAYLCCNNRDHAALEKLRAHLHYFVSRDRLHVWDDSQAEPGKPWRLQLEEALQTTKVAVLFISTAFLNSDFYEQELPHLIQAAETEGVRIVSVLLGASAFEHTQLRSYTTANVWVDNTLVNAMEPHEEEAFWKRLAEYVRQILLESP